MDQDQDNKKTTNTGLLVVILVILFVGGFGIYFYLRSQNLLPTKLQPSPSQEQPSPSPVVPTSQSLITITAAGFSPQTLLVKKGAAVTWTNKDSRPHQIASDPHPSHNSLPTLLSDEPLSANSSFTYTFDKVGTFTYHDEINPLKLGGTIVVQ